MLLFYSKSSVLNGGFSVLLNVVCQGSVILISHGHSSTAIWRNDSVERESFRRMNEDY